MSASVQTNSTQDCNTDNNIGNGNGSCYSGLCDGSTTNFYVKESETLKAIQNYFPFIYRINDGVSTNTILMSVCKERGWKEFTEEDLRTVGGDIIGWNLWWRCSSIMTRNPYKQQMLYSWQYTNHIPNSFYFCRKSYLTLYIRSMSQMYGSIYDFYPSSFVLPNEYPQFLAEHCRRSDKDIDEARNVIRVISGSGNSDFVSRTPIWISKPNGKSQGRGIFIFNELKLLQYTSPSVLQEYIAKPLLIGGYKFDLRLYVCVASNNPLNIYMYHEGLTRFATSKYNLQDINCTFSHLTNCTLNKLGPGYLEDKLEIGPGCKWTLRQLRQYFTKTQHISSDWFLWQKIVSIIILTVVGEAGKTAFSHKRNCFNVFGFDILIDEQLKPWLLEVNLSPGLGGDCLVDEVVKRPMLHDLFNLLGFPDCSEFVEMVDSKEPVPIPKAEPKPIPKAKEDGKICTVRPYTALRPATFCTFNEKKLKKFPIKYPWGQKNGNGNGNFESLNLEGISTKMIDRLTSLQAIYGKHVSLDLKASYNSKSNNNPNPNGTKKKSQLANNQSSANNSAKTEIFKQFSREFWNLIPGVDKDVSLAPRRPGIGIRHRNWNEPIKRQGGWIRIFPFNFGNEAVDAKGRLSTIKIKEVVAKTTSYLRAAQDIVNKFPHQTDEFYNKHVHRACRLNTEIWLPPT